MMKIFRLAAGGRIAIRSEDIVVAQVSPWGSIVQLTGGAAFELEHSLEDLVEMVDVLTFDADGTRLNPDRIAMIWEGDGVLHYRMDGGLELRQSYVDLDLLIKAVDQARRNREAAFETAPDER